VRPTIESINIGKIAKLQVGAREVDSAICKHPTRGVVTVSRSGIITDEVGDTKHHGGPDRALHCFSMEHYDYFRSLINLSSDSNLEIPDIPWVGENITFHGYTDEQAFIGDRLQIGSVVMEVSMPTVRCAIPGVGVGLPKLTKWMIESLRTGFYMRVIKPGVMSFDSEVEVLSKGYYRWSVARLSSLYYEDVSDVKLVKSVMGLSKLAQEWKDDLWKKHEKCKDRRQDDD